MKRTKARASRVAGAKGHPPTRYRLVERPAKHAGAKHDYAAILSTATNGKAVRVPLNGATAGGVRAALAQALLRRGYQAHTSARAGVLLVWCDAKR